MGQNHEQTDGERVALPRGWVPGTTIAATILFFGGVALLAQFGGPIASIAQERVAETALREGQRYERAGMLSEAIGAYRKALARGLSHAPNNEDCMRRLSALLAEQGRKAEYRLRRNDSLVAGGEFDVDAQAALWIDDDATRQWIGVDSIEKVSGVSAVRIDCASATSDVLLSQTIYVVPGKAYELSIWSRALDITSASFDLAAGENDVRQEIVRADLGGDHEWRQDSFIFTASRETRAVHATIQAAHGAGEVWIDSVSLRDAQPSLIENGSFDQTNDVRASWLGKLQDGMQIESDTENVVEGSTSLRAEIVDGINFGFWQTIDVTPGAAYRLEGWIRTENLGGLGACLEVQDAESGWEGFSAATSPRITGTQDWQRVSIEFVVPAETAWLSVLLRRPSAGGPEVGIGRVWFDAVRLSRAEGANS
ncbi:MAG: hypothetical protein IT366_05395 [Candidatus Hydrogenedentes bacterium]|nr:hypothetical protein [Candidatus Hydrogenedentota bacterium]